MERKIILYIACSLDGKIADHTGGVSWLESLPNPDQSDYGYTDFLASVDTVIMGNNTYRQILGFGIDFPYKKKINYVITRNKSLVQDENVQYVSEDIHGFILEVKQKPGKGIWCIGGGELIAFLLNHALLDEVRVFIMPVILGSGVPLVAELNQINHIQLIKTQTYASGAIELSYCVLHSL
jgi:dihydrofolate reductase